MATKSAISPHRRKTQSSRENVDISPPKKKLKLATANLLSYLTAFKSEESASCATDDNDSDTSSTSQYPNFLYIVDKVRVVESDGSLELTLSRVGNKAAKYTCHLVDSWSSTNVKENDIVHVLTENGDDQTMMCVSDKSGHLIVNPHVILSGTNVLSGMFCMRKSALNWKFKETDSNSTHMMLGTILHVLFQTAVSNRKYEKSELNKLLIDLLKKRQIVSQLYGVGLDEESVIKETAVYLDSIEKWLRDHMAVKQPNNGKNFQIQDICDIEESIWSPKYGVKGKLDLTLRISLKMSAFKTLNTNTKENSFTNGFSHHVIPAELKSGKTTFSAEHEGQLMLYSMLNHEKRNSTDFGLLLYLKDMNMKFIKVNRVSLRGLIQLRNELVYYISSNSLPELKNESRVCTKCPFLIPCSLLAENCNEKADFYEESLSHLAVTDRDYFKKWFQMLEHEFDGHKQFDSGDLIWWKSLNELELTGWTVSNLKLKNSGQTPSSEYTGEGFHLFDFDRTKPKKRDSLLKENDMILLSSQTDNQVGMAQGFVRHISPDQTRFQLLVDKNLAQTPSFLNHLFRIDKINFRSAIQLNYTNLARLMSPAQTKLRSFVVDKRQPTFEERLNKQYIVENKQLLKKLNQSQQAAIIKSLMAKDYLLIKGYPGTGKTTTIAALISILVKLDRKVLFCSFTNSAVDNLLLKAYKDYGLDFVRIGSYERVHPDIQKFESSQLTANLTSVAELDKFYQSKKLIATTCSSISHVVFSKIEFDYCIVDEASQVLLTTCLGPLFISKKFILVGDLEQLPPIIKSKEARLMGMGVSLFEWLDSPEGSVELVHQYRMNNEIMNLANEVTYAGKLKCMSEKIANSCVQIDTDFLSTIDDELLRTILTKPVVFIDTSELMRPLVSKDLADSEEYRTVNRVECEIVRILCSMFNKHSDCNSAQDIGIIAPYNNQVNELQSSFKSKRFLDKIEINTVDQFQGRDKKLIVFSFTNSQIKSDETKEFEILNDKRRLTVALTRAKQKLILIGSIQCLTKYKPMARMISVLKEKSNVIVTLNSMDQMKSLFV